MPSHAPFAPGICQWPTLVAEFIWPIFRNEPETLHWFVNHGTDFQLCFASDNHVAIGAGLDARASAMKIKPKTKANPAATVAGALGGSRWAGERAGGSREPNRSLHLLCALHAASELYIDMLVQDPGNAHWRRENNTDANNPCGCAFESVFHLMANLSNTDVGIELSGRFPYMPARRGVVIPVRL